MADEEPTDIRSELQAAFDEAQSEHAEPEESAQSEAPAETQPADTPSEPADAAADEPVKPVEDEHGRVRDPKTGKFVAKTDSGDDEPAAASEEGEGEQRPVELGPLEPPAHWDLEAQKLFRKQPEAVQKYFLDREKAIAQEYEKKTQGLATEKQRVDQINAILAPHREAIITAGMNEAQYIEHLMGLGEFARSKPKDFIKWFAGQHRVDLSEFAPQIGTKDAGEDGDDWLDEKPVQPAARDPNDPLLQQIERLNNELTQLKSGFQTQVSAQTEAQNQQTIQQIQNFATAVDENGQPLRPYWNDVENEIAGLLQAGMAGPPDAPIEARLEQAYRKAVRMNDNVAAKEAERQEAERQRQALAERKRKSEEAQRAGASVTGSPAGTTSPAPAASVRDEVARLYYGGG